MNNNDNLIFEGIEEGYRVYRNSEGLMEGYKKTGKNKYADNDAQGSDVKRVVTNQKTLEGFAKYVRGLRGSTNVKDKRLKPSQLPNLPFDS